MGKALALDTPVPTPEGWATMGGLRVGDEVFDEQGQACRVTYASPTFTGRRCFRVGFDDGSSVVADAEHRWLAYYDPAWTSHRGRTASARRGGPAGPRSAGDQWPRRRLPRVVTTEEMLAEGVRVPDGSRPNWYVPLAGAIEAPEATLPVDPYVLGCWLGGGTASGGELTTGHADADHFAGELEMRGYGLIRSAGLRWATTPVAGTGAWQGYGGPWRVLARELQQVGLLGGAAKHVPAGYLRASAKQRLELLQGLMDAGGTVANGNGTVELCLANRHLLEQAWELVCSLGHKPHPIRARAIPLPDGRAATAWRFCWTPRDPVFRMPRKAEGLDMAVSSRRRNDRHTRRAVVTIDEVPTVPVRCIAVDSPSHLFLAGRCMTPTHNTSLALGMLSHVGMVLRRPALLFSLEMGHLELTQRLLASEARVDAQRLRTGHLHEADWSKVGNAVSRLSDATVFIDDNPNLTVMDIRARARRLRKNEGDLGIVVVDYLQLMTGHGRAESRQVEVAEISRGLKILARELECPVVALSQLSRNLEARQDKRPMLSDLRESGCMPASTTLHRADTGAAVSLGELVLTQERPLVWSLDDRWRLVPRRVTKVFPSGIRPVYRLRLASGLEVEATDNHPFRTVRGWEPLADLAPGVAVAVPRRVPAPVATERWDEDEIVLLAHLLGDGQMGPVARYATVDPANREAVEAAARRRFGITARGRLNGRTWQMELPSPYRLTHGRHHPIRRWLEPLGLWGRRSHDKFIPEQLFGVPDDQLALFLRHLWATDGSLTLSRNGRGPVVRAYYSSQSRKLVEGVRRALLRLGITSRAAASRKAGYRLQWNLAVTGCENLRRFLEVVGCHGRRGDQVARALELVSELVPNPNADLVPWAVREQVVSAMQQAGVTRRELATQLGERYCGSYLLGSRDRPRRFSRRRLGSMAEIVEDPKLMDLATSDVLWDEVVEITALGEKPTFDATVEDTHNFVADGVIAHNSLEQDADVVLFIFREEQYDPDTPIDRRGMAEVIVAKHRNGPTGSAHLVFLNQYARFDNLKSV